MVCSAYLCTPYRCCLPSSLLVMGAARSKTDRSVESLQTRLDTLKGVLLDLDHAVAAINRYVALAAACSPHNAHHRPLTTLASQAERRRRAQPRCAASQHPRLQPSAATPERTKRGSRPRKRQWEPASSSSSSKPQRRATMFADTASRALQSNINRHSRLF